MTNQYQAGDTVILTESEWGLSGARVTVHQAVDSPDGWQYEVGAAGLGDVYWIYEQRVAGPA